MLNLSIARQGAFSLSEAGIQLIRPQLNPQTAVANAPLVWGYRRLCLAEALSPISGIMYFNCTARKIVLVYWLLSKELRKFATSWCNNR